MFCFSLPSLLTQPELLDREELSGDRPSEALGFHLAIKTTPTSTSSAVLGTIPAGKAMGHCEGQLIPQGQEARSCGQPWHQPCPHPWFLSIRG